MAEVYGSGQLAGLAGLFEAAPDAMVVVDQRGEIRHVNHQTELLFSWDRADLVGQPIEILVPEVLRDYHRRHQDRYASEPRLRPMGAGLDLRARRKDGAELPVEISLGPFLSGSDLLTVAVIRDVTRARREDRLFRALVEAAPDATLVADEDGRIILVNARLEALFGYRRDELVGRTVEILIPDRFVGMHVGFRAGYITQPRIRPMGQTRDLLARRLDGSEFPVEISLAPLQTDQGTLVTASIRDVTERRRFEESEELYRIKDEFFATVSHELRTPLASIIGYGELLEDSDHLAPECREFLSVLMRNAKRELRLVEDLLTLVKVEESGLPVRLKTVEIGRLIGDSVRSVLPLAEELGVSVVADLADDPIRAELDEQRIAQAVDNLLSNALKFTPHGGTVTVRLSCDLSGAHVDVLDTGTGIDEADRHHVFERLYRSSQAVHDQVPGAGLGLAIALAVVEAHGGSLTIAETGPRGTRMRISLPVGTSSQVPARHLGRDQR